MGFTHDECDDQKSTMLWIFLTDLASPSALRTLLHDVDGWMGEDYKVRKDGVRPVPDIRHQRVDS